MDSARDRPSRLLVVGHAPTAAVRRLLDAVVAGGHDDALEGVDVVVRPALEATARDVLAADGLVLVTPANFGYMSGALKHFFDTVFLEVGGALGDDGGAGAGAGAGDGAGDGAGPGRRPFGLLVHGRYDTTGAVRAVLAITGALPWRQAAEVVEVLGAVGEAEEQRAYELGGTIAALLTG